MGGLAHQKEELVWEAPWWVWERNDESRVRGRLIWLFLLLCANPAGGCRWLCGVALADAAAGRLAVL